MIRQVFLKIVSSKEKNQKTEENKEEIADINSLTKIEKPSRSDRGLMN